jgi:type 1 fimbriae regulatory protein FimB/type 1 fimbriae regulatory protein FimE
MATLAAPNTESCNISRDHLTATEVKRLIEAVKNKGGWYSYRNSLLILMLYRHGLRRLEAARLRWSDIDLEEGTIYIRRIKGSHSGRHP